MGSILAAMDWHRPASVWVLAVARTMTIVALPKRATGASAPSSRSTSFSPVGLVDASRKLCLGRAHGVARSPVLSSRKPTRARTAAATSLGGVGGTTGLSRQTHVSDGDRSHQRQATPHDRATGRDRHRHPETLAARASVISESATPVTVLLAQATFCPIPSGARTAAAISCPQAPQRAWHKCHTLRTHR